MRSSTARCLASLTSAWMGEVMPPLLKLLIPRLSSIDDDARMGAVETVVQVWMVWMEHRHWT